jgi:hypothetical protein
VNREILSAVLPWVAALAALCGAFVAVARLSGGSWKVARLRSLHACESGAIQSLAFVLTLPFLVMILLFIVQVSQLMIALVTINYAAFASARAASVWVPTMIQDGYAGLGFDTDDQNELPPAIAPGVPLPLSAETIPGFQSRKLEKVWTAAALACAPIAPSRTTADSASGAMYANRTASVMKQLYPRFDPAGTVNPRMPGRIDAKLGYSFENTHVVLQFEDRNSQPVDGTVTYNPIGHPTVTYYPSEVGWQDPITVTVYHDLAMLPGAGKMLSKLIQRADGGVDTIAPTIRQEAGIYKHRIKASATMTNEGIQSRRPYVHSPDP